MLLSQKESYQVLIAVILFLIFAGYFKQLFLNEKMNSKEIIVLTALFAVWFGMTKALANITSYGNNFHIKPVNVTEGADKNYQGLEKVQWDYYNVQPLNARV